MAVFALMYVCIFSFSVQVAFGEYNELLFSSEVAELRQRERLKFIATLQERTRRSILHELTDNTQCKILFCTQTLCTHYY